MKRLFYIILLLLALVSQDASAQAGGPDYVSVIAYIEDHKTIRSRLGARFVLEEANKLMHKDVDAKVDSLSNINKALDKYNKAFDIIDLAYNSLRTVLNVKNSAKNISKTAVDYGKLIDEYNQQILLKGKPKELDIIIINTATETINKINPEAQNIINSLVQISQYIVGKLPITTAELNMIINSLNNSIDEIERILNKSYRQTYYYIQARLHYWKECLWQPNRPRTELINTAFGRWKESAVKALEKK